jgi:hypothetical protein
MRRPRTTVERRARPHYCHIIEAPWLLNGGHGASLRNHNATHHGRAARAPPKPHRIRRRRLAHRLVQPLGTGRRQPGVILRAPCGQAGGGARCHSASHGHGGSGPELVTWTWERAGDDY